MVEVPEYKFLTIDKVKSLLVQWNVYSTLVEIPGSLITFILLETNSAFKDGYHKGRKQAFCDMKKHIDNYDNCCQ